MERRAFIGGLALVVLGAPLPAWAQQAGKVYRIGYLDPLALSFERPQVLTTALREIGWVEKQHYVWEARWVDRRPERFTAFAAELVRLKVDVIVSRGLEATLAAKRATDAIPIVFDSVSDPVGAGLVTNLGRPEGNVTGLSDAAEQTAAKQLELLKEILPRLGRVEVLWDGAAQPHPAVWRRLQITAAGLRIALGSIAVPDKPALEQALETLRQNSPGAVLVFADEVDGGPMITLGDFALKQRLPLASNALFQAWNGGLMSYTRSAATQTRRAVQYVVRILLGAKPSELPVEEPSVFDLVVNTGTAKRLGLRLPPSILLRATQVIE